MKAANKVDKGKVAGAAAELLGAAQDYGKLDKEKGIGQYVEKAENYLQQYETSGQSAPTTTNSGTPTKPEAQPESHVSGGDAKDSGSAGGVGDYLNMAQVYDSMHICVICSNKLLPSTIQNSAKSIVYCTNLSYSSMESASHNKPSYHHEKHGKSSSELLSSAKLVAEAAKNTLHHESDKVDKGKVAGAVADLLGTASHYGKLDQEKGAGKYVEKAENYLHHYHSSHSIPTTTHSGAHSTKPEKHSESLASGGDGHDSGSGGFGDYMKMAQGTLRWCWPVGSSPQKIMVTGRSTQDYVL
ncbi:hypothetical protein CRYUN_Cryun06bG0166400 [Craigia yunnanensis]